MEVVQRYVLRRIDGAYMNIRFERVDCIRKAVRLDEDGFQTLMTSEYYKPPNPQDYYLQKIEIEYREVQTDVQQVGNDQQDSCSDGEV